MNDIAAIVVTHQSAETIDECLARLRAASGTAAIRVVDNGSDDGTMEIVQRHAAHDARVRFIANPDNPGFAVACNQGAADLRGNATRWLAFVNPDCLVEPDALARLRDHACATDALMLLGADLVDEAGGVTRPRAGGIRISPRCFRAPCAGQMWPGSSTFPSTSRALCNRSMRSPAR